MSSNQTGHFTVDQLLADQRWVHGLARALLSREGAGEVEDLVQDTWVAAAQHPPGADRGARPWLATVVRNLFPEVHRADQQGRFAIGGLPPGAVTLTAVAADAPLAPDTAVESERATLDLVEGQRTVDISLVIARRQHAIAGVVLAAGGLPAAGVRVTLDRAGGATPFSKRPPAYRALTGADGAFTIDELPPGIYQVVASVSGLGQATLGGIRAGGAPVRLVLESPAGD